MRTRRTKRFRAPGGVADDGEFNRLRTFIRRATPVGAGAESNRFRLVQTSIPDFDDRDFGAQPASGLYRLLLYAARAGEETTGDGQRAGVLRRGRRAHWRAFHLASRMRAARHQERRAAGLHAADRRHDPSLAGLVVPLSPPAGAIGRPTVV